MIEKIGALWPEIILFAAACIVMVVGLSPTAAVRRLCAPLAGAALIVAGIVAWFTTPAAHGPLPMLPLFGKTLVAGVGVLLALLLAGTPDREYESAIARGATGYDPIRANRAEFWAFFLFSLTGAMLCAGADDLIWLFLALELTSLPTYIMVAVSTGRNRSMEAAVKYFFLGALGAAVFLYGFTLLYGGTGTTRLFAPAGEPSIASILAAQAAGPGINAVAMTGLVLSFLGVCFKIAAVPMHFYTPDVYQGASSAVAGFLAFVPKAAGFFTILILAGAAGWWGSSPVDAGGSLPQPLHQIVLIVAILTMSVGNALAVVQSSAKRMLAYSSIAHSGYMLVGVVAGPGPANAPYTSNGVAAVLFYLLSYGVMNLGAFAVLASLERRRADGSADEADDVNDLKGLCATRPLLGWTLVLSVVGLLGLPPLLGFWAKLPLFTSAISSNEIGLVIVLGLNSAVAAYYYLRLASVALLESPELTNDTVRSSPFPARAVAGLASAVGIVLLAAWPLNQWAMQGGRYQRVEPLKAAEGTPPARVDAGAPAAR
ncbi:MAG: NADH-quinone oxidoreductase subunit N [Phycisphaeraceae bacterium]|nr:NADH-quinone oxidoreductase subunit N [Phycisphaeraceae bacterium]